MTVIGLTGGIASGKSTVSKIAASEFHVHVIDADKLGHQAYEPSTECFKAIVKEFGPDIVAADGTIDRKKLGAKVFAEGSSLARLTDIVWPAIKRLAVDEIATVQANRPEETIVLEAAVLIEAGWQDIVDEVWTVTVDEEVAVHRAMRRDGVDREAVLARVRAQTSNQERLSAALVNIDNSGDEEQLRKYLTQEFKRLEIRGKPV